MTTTSAPITERGAQRPTALAQEPRRGVDPSVAVFAQLMRTLTATIGGAAGSAAVENVATDALYNAMEQRAEVDPAAGRDPASEAERRMREGPASPLAVGSPEERSPAESANASKSGRPEGAGDARAGMQTGEADDPGVGERRRRVIDERARARAPGRGATAAAGPTHQAPANAPQQGSPAPFASRGAATSASSVPNGPIVSNAVNAASVGAVRATTGTAPAMPGAVAPAPAKTGEAAMKPQASPLARHGNSALQAEAEAALGKVQGGLASLVNTKGGQMTLRLNPEALGEVRVHLTLRQGVVTARVEASQESARGLLEVGVDRLRAALEARGLKVDSLEVQRWADARGAEVARMDQHAARQEPGPRPSPQDAGTGWRPEGDAERREDTPGEDRGRDDDRRHEAGGAGRDSGGAGPEGVPGAAEPLGDDGSAVRHGSAHRLTVRLDTIV